MSAIIAVVQIAGSRSDAGTSLSNSHVPQVRRPADASAAPAGLAQSIVEERFEHARLREWAERLAAANGPTALLIARPAPDGFSPHYPSAVAAYREMSEVIDVL